MTELVFSLGAAVCIALGWPLSWRYDAAWEVVNWPAHTRDEVTDTVCVQGAGTHYFVGEYLEYTDTGTGERITLELPRRETVRLVVEE